MNSISKIAVLTSGGDAPGMNAALRAVVRSGIYYGIDVFGVYQGYDGLIHNDMKMMTARSVNHILQRGGTILKSARSKEFRTPEGRKKAFENLQKREIDALVVIGGDGTFTGAHTFYKEFGVPVIGIPGTIDNDLFGTDYTIGFDTATNTVIEAVDKIRDTALSHNRLFFIEVMGRDSGFIAATTGLASGAVSVIVPEEETTIQALMDKLNRGIEKEKSSSIVIVAEGGKSGNATELAQVISEKFPYYETKVTILGHIQRGGSPSTFDRNLASRLGVAAVEAIRNGETDLMAGIINNHITYTPLSEAISDKQTLDHELLRIANILAT